MKYLGIAPARILPEAEDEIIAVSNHKFALLVNTVFGTIDDLRPARKHLRSQRVNACHAEVDVTGAFSAAGAHNGVIGAIEEYLNLIAPHDSENRRSV